MTNQVVITNEQTAQPVDVERWTSLAQAVLKAERVPSEAELSILFVDRDTIATLNEEHLHHVGPTDVLSFAIDDQLDDEMMPTLLGDVVICPQVAYDNASANERSYEDEIALLVVHGILHIRGMDHEQDDEAEIMEAREQVLLAAHHASTSAS